MYQRGNRPRNGNESGESVDTRRMGMARHHMSLGLGRLLTLLVVVLWALALLLLVGNRAGAQGPYDARAPRHSSPPPAAHVHQQTGVASGLLKTEPSAH